MSFCESCGAKLEWPSEATDAPPTDNVNETFEEAGSEQINETQPQDAEQPEALTNNDEVETETAEIKEVAEEKEEAPVISPTKTKPKKEKKPVDRKKLAMASTIGVLCIAIATVFTLSFLALPSPQKWLDNANEAFIEGDKETFYNSFSKPEPMISNSETFYEELASDWSNIVAQMERAIEKDLPFATLQTSDGRDILQLTVVEKWGMTDVTVRYLPVEVTIVAAKKHQTIMLPNMELFSVRDDEAFTLYAVPGSYSVELTYKGESKKDMMILQSTTSQPHVLGDAS